MTVLVCAVSCITARHSALPLVPECDRSRCWTQFQPWGFEHNSHQTKRVSPSGQRRCRPLQLFAQCSLSFVHHLLIPKEERKKDEIKTTRQMTFPTKVKRQKVPLNLNLDRHTRQQFFCVVYLFLFFYLVAVMSVHYDWLNCQRVFRSPYDAWWTSAGDDG